MLSCSLDTTEPCWITLSESCPRLEVSLGKKSYRKSSLFSFSFLWEDISNVRNSVTSHYQTTRTLPEIVRIILSGSGYLILTNIYVNCFLFAKLFLWFPLRRLIKRSRQCFISFPNASKKFPVGRRIIISVFGNVMKHTLPYKFDPLRETWTLRPIHTTGFAAGTSFRVNLHG